MRRLQNLAGLLLVITILIALFSMFPLGTALQLGGDEGYELMKGFLCSKGFSLYKDIWNDQPPVLTILLSTVFKVFGPSVLAARVVAVGFGLLLFGVFYEMVRLRCGVWAALLATFLLLASPPVLQLSVSIMAEMPTIAMALLSVLLVFRWRPTSHRRWLVASAVIMGVALGIKLTAVMILPAIVVEIGLSRWAKRDPSWARAALADMLIWGTTVGIVFAAILLLWGRGSVQTSMQSHFAPAQSVSGLGTPDDYRFQLGLFQDQAECVLAAAVGLILVAYQRRLPDFAFPIVLLLTALAVHAFHRPWWPYYYLHFALPLAWLAGFAVAESIRKIASTFQQTGFRFNRSEVWKSIPIAILCALAFASAEARLEATVKSIRQSPRAAGSPVLGKMREYAPFTHWVYAQPVIYPFHAKLPVPPELAVVMLKRFWSGQITTAEIVGVCRRYRPEQILLFVERAGGEWLQLLNTNYTLLYGDKEHVLYVAKGLREK